MFKVLSKTKVQISFCCGTDAFKTEITKSLYYWPTVANYHFVGKTLSVLHIFCQINLLPKTKLSFKPKAGDTFDMFSERYCVKAQTT